MEIAFDLECRVNKSLIMKWLHCLDLLEDREPS